MSNGNNPTTVRFPGNAQFAAGEACRDVSARRRGARCLSGPGQGQKGRDDLGPGVVFRQRSGASPLDIAAHDDADGNRDCC